jgi:leucyl-tRNA synthetase
MELVNTIQAVEEGILLTSEGASVLRSAIESVIVLLSPIVPHFAEELWEALGNSGSVLEVPWPTYREEAIAEDEILIVVQVNGKVRSRFHISADAREDEMKAAALADDRIVARIAGRPVKRVIVAQKKLVNIVV